MSTSSRRPPSLLRAAVTGAAWLGALNGLAGIAVYALRVFLNHSVPDAPTQLGDWFVVSYFLLLCMFVFELGLPAALMQRKDLSQPVIGGMARIQLVVGLAGAGLAWVAAPLVSQVLTASPSGQLVSLLRLIAPGIAVIATGLPPKALLQREMRFRAVATVEGVSTMLFVVVGAILVGSHGMRGLVLATLARHSLETSLYWILGPLSPSTLLLRAEWKDLREPVRFGVGMGAQSLLGTAIRNADVFIVRALAGAPAVAVYTNVQGFVVLPYSKLVTFVMRAALPTFAKVQHDPERMLRGLVKMQRYLALAVLPTLAGLAAVAPRLLALSLGPQFAADLPTAVVVMRLLCFGAVAFTYAFAAGVAVNAQGASGRMFLRQCIGSVAVLVLMAAGSPWGLLGISAGRALSLVVVALLVLDLTRRQLGFSTAAAWTTVRQALPAALVMSTVVTLAGALGSAWWPASAATSGGVLGDNMAMGVVLGVQVLLGLGAYVLALRVLGVSPMAELRALRGERAAAPAAQVAPPQEL